MVNQAQESRKELQISLLEEFYNKYGRLPSNGEKVEGMNLCSFLKNIKYGNTKITEKQRERLLSLGFIWDISVKEKEKERKIRIIEEFCKKHKRLPKYNEKVEGILLGKFLCNIKSGNTSITYEQIDRLLQLGFSLDTCGEENSKEKKIKLVEKFYQKYRRLPRTNEIVEGISLGIFLKNIKDGNTTITSEQMNRLTALGFKIESIEDKKERKIRLVEEFYRINKRLPRQREMYEGVAIGNFLDSIKHGGTSVSEEQMNRLLILGFVGTDIARKVNPKIKQLEEFYQKHGRLPEPGESLGKEKEAIGNILLSIKLGKIILTKTQFIRLQNMDATLTREQVSLVEKGKIYVKK